MKILVYPFSTNPYQKLLYSELEREEIYAEFFDTYWMRQRLTLFIILFFPRLIYFRIKGYSIFHLHWLYFNIPIPIYTLRLIASTIFTYVFLTSVKLLRYKLVWTIHNTLPHEQQTINDLETLSFLTKISNVKIVHSSSTFTALRSLNVDTNNIHIIPIGSFTHYYPNSETKQQARRKLSIPNNAFTFLYFGYIRQYKGLDSLLGAFTEILKLYPKVKLIIAGKCLDGDVYNIIQNFVNKYPSRIHLYNKHIPDEDVQLYFNASDVVVLPFKRVTTSSTALLALNFKRPIIFPNLGNLIDLPYNVGFRYTHNNEEGLKNAMIKSINSDSLDMKGEFGFEFTKTLSWENIAKETRRLYSLLEENRLS